MSVFKRAIRRIPFLGANGTGGRIQDAPIAWSPDGGGTRVETKADHAARIGTSIVVSGWSSADGVRMGLAVGGQAVDSVAFRVARPDVNRYLGVATDRQLGWVLLALDAPMGDVSLQCMGIDGSPALASPLRVNDGPISRDAHVQFEPALAALRQRNVLDDDALDRLVSGAAPASAETQSAVGALDDARSSSVTRDAVVAGWVVCAGDARCWLETTNGRRVELDDAFRSERTDIEAAVPARFRHLAGRAGFLVHLPDVAPHERVKLVVGDDDTQETLAELACADWGLDLDSASRWLMSYPTSITGLAARIPVVDMPVLDPMIRARQDRWRELATTVGQAGEGPEAPFASIVVPLFGRFDFVEHQLAEFARDRDLVQHVEIIYVLDDPNLVHAMASQANSLHALYGVPFKWVWGEANRGFSGANNLGASQARGDVLVFLNSDAFPRDAGWVRAMADALAGHPDIGALGIRLLFPDGSMQHCGMEFRAKVEIGIIANTHPRMGLDPRFDPHRELAKVMAVTGACLAIRRADFDAVGGWDTGYLIGDFEDSDLCMKVRRAGKSIGYLPTVELTHLERQSFKMLGDGDFRTRVVVYNAVRHQARWPGLLGEGAMAMERADV